MKEVAKVGVKLNVLERLGLLGLLPKEGSFSNLKLIRLIREELSFTEEENASLQFRTEGQMIVWNTIRLINKETGEVVKGTNAVLDQMAVRDPDAFDVDNACPDKEIYFGETIKALIVKALKDLDKAEKITEEHYSLYEKFMEGQEE